MLIAVNGDFGSGKTLFLVLVACSVKREVWSNFKIKIDNYHKLDVEHLIDLGYNKEVMIDEAYTWMESRSSGSALNRYMSYLIFQVRHRTLNIYTTEQLFHSVDIRFRELAHRVVECSRVNNGRGREYHHFRFDIWNTYDNSCCSWLANYNWAKKFFPLYDTFEIIDPFSKESLELEILKGSPRKLYDKIHSIAVDLKKELKTVSHSSVRMALLKNGYDGSFERLVYSCMKELDALSQ